MPRTTALPVILFAMLIAAATPAGAHAAETLSVFLPSDGRTYFESNLAADLHIAAPAETATLVVRLDGVDVTSLFTTTNRRAKATLTGLTPGPHTLEAQATGQVFDPLLFQFVTRTFTDTSAFTVATPTSTSDFINLGIDHLAGRDLLAARDAFTHALAIQRFNQQASLLLALTRIAILLDPTLPGSNPALLDSAGEFLDALGFPPQGRDVFDFTAMLPMDAMGHVMLPPTAPQGPEGQRFAVQDVLPQIVAALNNLRIIGKQFVYLFPADRLGEGLSPVEIDFADVQILRGALFLAQASILTGNAYNLDLGAPDVLVQKANEGTFDVQQDVILANPDLLRLVATTDLPTIKGAISGGINSILTGLASMDGETDPQDNDLLVIAPEQKINEAKAKKLLVALRGSLTRKTVIPDVRFNPADPMDTDYSTPVFLGALFSKNGIDIRSKLPQFQRRPDGKNVVLSRTFPDPKIGGLFPTFTQSEAIFLTDTIAPSIDVHATGFPEDPNMFHVTGSVVEEDLAAGLDVANWEVTLTLEIHDLIRGTSMPSFDVTDRFPLARQMDGTLTFDSFIRFVDPVATHATLTFKAMDLNGNVRKESIDLDLVAAIFLDASTAHAVFPIHSGDGLSAHFVQTGTQFSCCSEPDISTAETTLALQLGDPGVVAVYDGMITKELDLRHSNGQIPLTGPGVGRMQGYLRVAAPGILNFYVDPGFLGAIRLRIGGRIIAEWSKDSGTLERAVFFPTAGLYAFELIHQANYSDPRVIVRVSNQVGRIGVEVQLGVLYKTLDTDGDGVTDSVEMAAGLNPNDPDDLNRDDDGDGLTGLQELNLGTKANNPDSDGDTLSDSEELVPGADGFVTSPTNADTEGDGRPDGTDPIPVFAQAELTALTPVLRPSASTVTIQLKLRDGTAIQKAGIPVRITVNGSARFATAATEGTLVAGGSTATVDMQTTSAGRVSIDLSDTVAQTVTLTFLDAFGIGIDGQVYYSDFESDAGGFTQTEGTVWERGAPTYGPSGAVSGGNLWGTTLDGPYPGQQTSVLQSPVISIPGIGTTARLRFTHFFESVEQDVGSVLFRVLSSGFQSTRASFTGPLGGYKTENLALVAFAGGDIQLDFRFKAITSNQVKAGWYIDDVQVFFPGRKAVVAVFQ